MPAATRQPAPLAFKPDLADAARRWDAYYAGEIIDRPVVCVTAPKEGRPRAKDSDYYERVHGDIDDIIERALVNAEATYYAGEAVPAFWLSFGPDEIAAFCGAELLWTPDAGNTNWSKPLAGDLDHALPITLKEGQPLWQRLLEFCRRAAARMAGKMLVSNLDLHTNMDLLSALRGPERLCLDLHDCPALVDRAMREARAVFPAVWEAIRAAGRLDECGHCQTFYSMEGAAVLQCDFSGLIGPEMFRRWVLPALEEEAALVKHALYHWDGPGALVHTDALIASKGLHTLSYVPGDGHGGHSRYLDLFKRVQAGGKAVQIWGSPDEVRKIHRELRPEKAFYCTWAGSPAEADALLEWFVRHT